MIMDDLRIERIVKELNSPIEENISASKQSKGNLIYQDIKVSILVPVYKTEEFLETCILSILEQTYKNIEIVLTLNGYDENAMRICKKYKQKDNRIVIDVQKHQGLCRIRQSGINISSGEYVMFVDSDDWLIKRNAVELMVDNILQTNSDILICDYIKYYQGMDINDKLIEKPEIQTYGRSFLKNEYPRYLGRHAGKLSCTLWGKLYKSSFLKQLSNDYIFPDITVCEDLWINMNVFPFINSVSVFLDKLYAYRQGFGITFRYDEKRFAEIEVAKNEQFKIIQGLENKVDIITKKSLFYECHLETVYYFWHHCIFVFKHFKTFEAITQIIMKLFEYDFVVRAIEYLKEYNLEDEPNEFTRKITKLLIEKDPILYYESLYNYINFKN